MSIGNEYQILLEEIFNGEKDIAVFVLDGEHYYVIDRKENFCIDVRPEYKCYIAKGWLKERLYDRAVSEFRNGVPVLTKSTFKDYIKLNNVPVHTMDKMRTFFISGRNNEELQRCYHHIEHFLSSSTEPVSAEWDSWRMRLPRFYINFDKHIFRHTDWERNHEDLVPEEWHAQANNSFGLLVPDRYQYWLINGMNFWKLQM